MSGKMGRFPRLGENYISQGFSMQCPDICFPGQLQQNVFALTGKRGPRGWMVSLEVLVQMVPAVGKEVADKAKVISKQK